jgi:3-hydroxymyristoyl/3-hydroxydecanoyl-(acyl carrier protein) dehydratase
MKILLNLGHMSFRQYLEIEKNRSYTELPGIQISRDVQTVLPHRHPFIFVDELVHFDMQTAISFKILEPDNFQFYQMNHQEAVVYPKILLFEHAYQTMFLQGYYLGIAKKVWGQEYQPFGLATDMYGFKFENIRLDAGEKVITVSKLIRHVKNCYIIVQTEIFKENGELAASGECRGIFIKERLDELFGRRKFDQAEKNDGGKPHFSYCDEDNKEYFKSTNWFLNGHFPQFPCIPGCLLIQGLLQSTGYISIKEVRKIKFKKAASPFKKYRYHYEIHPDNICNFRIMEEIDQEVAVEGCILVA